MSTASAPVGSLNLDELHKDAIRLWIHVKTQNPAINPAQGIFFALTNRVWPSDTPEARSSIELCAVLNHAFGRPPLTDEQTKSLNIKAIALFLEYTNGGGPFRLAAYLTWANRLGYVLAVIALVVCGFSYWVVGLAIATWWCCGAARISARMQREESRPGWETPTIAALHLTSLLALYSVSILQLAFR